MAEPPAASADAFLNVAGEKGSGKRERLDVNCLSGSVLWWVFPLIKKGFPGVGLEESDLPSLPAQYYPPSVRETAQALWKQQRDSGSDSLWRVLWGMWRGTLVTWVGWNVVQGVLSSVARPLLLKQLIEAATNGDQDLSLYLLLVLGVVLFGEGLSAALGRFTFSGKFGAGYMSTMSSLIQMKSLRLAHTANGAASSSRSLVGNDVIRTYENFRGLGQIPSSFVQVACGTVTVVYTIGWKGLTGLAVLYVSMILNRWVAAKTKVVEARNLKASDERISLMTRVIEGAKAIKLCAWEENFLDTLHKCRKDECKHVKTYRMYQNTSLQLGRAAPVFASCVTFAFIVGTGDDLKASDVFAVVNIFQTLRLALILLPMAMTLVSSLVLSVDRTREFLIREEMPIPEVLPAGSRHAAVFDKVDLVWPGDVADASDAASSARGGGVVLRGVDVALPAGGVTALVGRVGSGKSTMLTAALGGLTPQTGKIALAGSVSYVPQKAFIVCGTLRDNILFGNPYDSEWLEQVLHMTTLDVDLGELVGGLDTEIGERGVTLSGGQQQRVAIARAVYAKPELLVMDDPLAAVDPQVANAIFDRVVRKRRPGQSVLIALNQLQLTSSCEYVVFLEGGAVREQGSFAELFGAKGPFWELVHESVGDGAEVKVESPQVAAQPPAREDNQKAGQLVKAEKQAQGSVGSSVLRQYTGAMGPLNLTVAAVLTVLCFGMMGFSDRWLAEWTNSFEDGSASGAPVDAAPSDGDDTPYLVVYVVACVAYAFFLLTMSWSFSHACVTGARRLHDDCLTRVFHAPIEWFDETPSGRILSRFSSDMTKVDIQLSQQVDAALQVLGSILVLIVIICLIVPPMSAVSTLMMIAYYLLVVGVDRANRQLKRHANTAMSPVLTTLAETSHLQGRLVIRALGRAQYFTDKFAGELEGLCNFNFLSMAVMHWSMLYSYGLSFALTLSAGMFMVYGSDRSSSDLGLALTYSFLLPYYLLMGSMMVTQMKASLTSLERLLEFSGDGVPQEAEWRLPQDAAIPASWPASGGVSFDGVSLCYQPGLPPAVKRVSFDISGGQRIGVVGRTGAGKSSLVLLLWRIMEASAGKIQIDGVDISKLGLQTLRQRMGIIPQEPLVVGGTVRQNLDPFSQQRDEALSEALEKVGMPADVLHLNAAKLSQGQRQLLSVARALVRSVRIIVMDEPTSNVDMITDACVQRAVRTALEGCTVITIAHRLNTIIDADRILVMEKGQVAEFGVPADLLASDGHLTRMVNGMGQAAAQALHQKAEAAKRGQLLYSPAARVRQHCATCTCGQQVQQHCATCTCGQQQQAVQPPHPPPPPPPAAPATSVEDSSEPAAGTAAGLPGRNDSSDHEAAGPRQDAALQSPGGRPSRGRRLRPSPDVSAPAGEQAPHSGSGA
eukprot:TRINITY_DN42967_c0_g1_i1.p1 TRINITY_DN42967_c0_g1~~TRINITY_DN42967_c0_g1_i1.p1  ORF type:complete len:1406 (+),score=499.49 TRINITY_DN42967_c0_g1_i1:76-4293(+)